MRSYRILTFGCQMNEHDSEKMSGVLEADGFTSAGSAEEADVVVLNTCSIREKAEQKFYSELGRLRPLKESNPSLIIAVSGCIAQQEGRRILRRAPYVDLILGNQNIKDLPGLIEAKRRSDTEVRTEYDQGYEHVTLPVRRTSSVTAFVNIMYGCDNFCSYCVVPHVRGREKSRMPGEILSEVQGLVADGCREVTLLGQNVNSYGAEGADFADLLLRVAGVDGIERVRFTSPHPKDFPRRLLAAIAAHPKLCKQIHLPLQAGSDRILEKMRRTYTRQEFLDLVDEIRAAIPEVGLSTDLIAGFPTETDAEFEDTVEVVERVRFDSAFIFKYSERKNTIAQRKYPDDVPEAVKSARVVRLAMPGRHAPRRHPRETCAAPPRASALLLPSASRVRHLLCPSSECACGEGRP